MAHNPNLPTDVQTCVTYLGGNLEKIAYTAVITAAPPEEAFDGVKLYEEMRDRQGLPPVDDPSYRGHVPFTNLIRLKDSGFLKEVPGRIGDHNKPLRALTKVMPLADTALAVCGAVFNWSIDHPNILPHEFLGRGGSLSRPRSLYYYQFYQHLLSVGNDATQNIPELAQAIGINDSRAHRGVAYAVEDLENAGIIEVTTGRTSENLAHRRLRRRITAAYRKPIAQLVGSIAQLEDPSAINEFKERAIQVLEHPQTLHGLLKNYYADVMYNAVNAAAIAIHEGY